MVNNLVIQIRKAIWQIPALITLAAITALGTNAWRNDGIPFVGDWSLEARFSDTTGDSMVISLEQAAERFKKDSVLFLDARPNGQYLEGHIRGALNLPWQEVDQHFMEMADRIDGSEMIITYCDGESCDLSHELALFLKAMGYDNVRVLVNGWTVWQHAGLPAE
jgi:3-mercaptopyruvate sulfurtransferase SseA